MRSKVLFNRGSVLLVNTALAVLIGDRQSIFLQQIHYWLQVNEEVKREQHHFDGRWWVRSTWREWHERDFPFWSERTIRRIYDDLLKLGVIVNRPCANARQGAWTTIDYARLEQLWRESVRQRRMRRASQVIAQTANPDQIVRQTADEDGLGGQIDQPSGGLGGQIDQPTGDLKTRSKETRSNANNFCYSQGENDGSLTSETGDKAKRTRSAKQQENDRWLQAIAEIVYNIEGEIPKTLIGRIAKVTAELRQLQPTMTIDDLRAFMQWWEKTNPTLSKPRTSLTINTHYATWLQQREKTIVRDDEVDKRMEISRQQADWFFKLAERKDNA